MIKYKAFLKVIELGNISKAAIALGYSQPGLSHIIDAFEQEIGFPLLVRNKDRIYPTEDGKAILTFCEQIVKNDTLIQEISSKVNGIAAGNIKLGVVTALAIEYIGDIISNFSSKYPGISLHLHDYGHKEIISQLQDGTIDIAFLNMLDDIPKGYSFYKLFEDTICLAVHKDSPLAAYDKIPYSYLNHCDMIMCTINWCDLIINIRKRKDIKPRIKYHTSSDLIALSLVEKNLGVYITSKCEERICPENVIFKEFAEDTFRTIGLCSKPEKNLSPAARAFIKEVTDQYTL